MHPAIPSPCPPRLQRAVDKVAAWAGEHGFVAAGDVGSPIIGPAGNVEYLLLRTADPACLPSAALLAPR